jgi:hypothetical protein
MINSTTSTDRAAHPELVSKTLKAVAKPVMPRSDKLSIENAALLRAELTRQPEIRADVVERARALAADPSYPSIQVLQQVGRAILNSPDLSEDES